jgi:hypothetical protein
MPARAGGAGVILTSLQRTLKNRSSGTGQMARARRAARARGISVTSFERYVQPTIRLVRLGRMVLVPWPSWIAGWTSTLVEPSRTTGSATSDEADAVEALIGRIEVVRLALRERGDAAEAVLGELEEAIEMWEAGPTCGGAGSFGRGPASLG